MIRKAEDSEADTADQSAIKLRAQQASNALVVTDQHPTNGTPPVNQLGLVKVPSMSNAVRYPSMHMKTMTPSLSDLFISCANQYYI